SRTRMICSLSTPIPYPTATRAALIGCAAMVTIRAATPSDVDAVLAFWNEATTVASSTDDSDGVHALLTHRSDALLVATAGGRLVGPGAGGWDGWRGTIYRLAVGPEQRRRGIATALVGAAESRLIALGARRLHLIVEEGELPAQEFWRS